MVKQKFNKTKIKLKSFDESPNHVMIILMVAVATDFLNVIGQPRVQNYSIIAVEVKTISN